MPGSTITEVQYGVRYQNGTEDWDTQRWYGTIDIPESRETFREQYDLRMASFGMPKMDVTFLTRTVTVKYSDVSIVDDTVQAPDPEPEVVPEPEPEVEVIPEAEPEPETSLQPEPEPEEEAPVVVEDETPAAPEEDVEPPTNEDIVEEELPGDADETSATDDEGASADGK